MASKKAEQTNGCGFSMLCGGFELGEVVKIEGILTVEETGVFALWAELVLLVPLVVGLEEDGSLRPDQGNGYLEVEVRLLACLGCIVGWTICAIDGLELGVRAARDPTVACHQTGVPKRDEGAYVAMYFQ